MRPAQAAPREDAQGGPARALVLAALLACAFLTPCLAGGAEEGVASWYGGAFHGRPTASGERFDKNDLTAAHRTLPFGTVLLVTNLDNDRGLRVRVNDRGPFVHGRILDCSEAAARALDFHRAGTARVRLEILGGLPEKDDPRLTRKERRRLREQVQRARRRPRGIEVGDLVLAPVDPSAGPFAVQVGAFAVRANADRFAATFRGLDAEARVVERGDGLFRVVLAPLPTRADADELVGRLRDGGQDAFVVRDDAP